MNPVVAIMQSPAWGQYPTAWEYGIAGLLAAKGDKGVGALIVNLAKMHKQLQAGGKLRETISTRNRALAPAQVP